MRCDWLKLVTRLAASNHNASGKIGSCATQIIPHHLATIYIASNYSKKCCIAQIYRIG